MKLMISKILILFFIIGVYSCNDIFLEDEQVVKGNISVINPNNQEDKGYKLVFHEKEFNSNIIEDYIADISGNDTIMVVKAISKKNCETLFYKVYHENGKSIKGVEEVSSNLYSQLISDAHLHNMFSSDNNYVCE